MSFETLAARLADKAAALARARAAAKRQRIWHRPDLLWPLFAKDR